MAAFPKQSPQVGSAWIGTGVENRHQIRLVHDQNFHSIIMFEPELAQCGKGLASCHVLPACSLVVTCPVTDDVRYSDWVFSIQRIPNFHRVDATNLIKAVTFRQSCCRPSPRHRSCFALWTLETNFYPSDNSPSASTFFATHDRILQLLDVPD